MAIIWACIPLANTILFAKVPIAPLIGEGEKGLTIKELYSKKLFWLFLLMMICAGASEQAVSQWASTFAEKGLGVSKTIGDLAGPNVLCNLYGTVQSILWKIWRKNQFAAFYDWKQHAMCGFLSWNRIFYDTGVGAYLLWNCRVICRNYVAGNV